MKLILPSSESDALAERLRREADATRPAFSAERHQRLVKLLATSDAPDTPDTPGDRDLPADVAETNYGWWLGGALAMAAALALAASLVLNFLAPPAPAPAPAPPVVAQEPTPQLPAMARWIDEQMETTPRVVASALERSRWAYVDHDALAAAQYLLDRLPVNVIQAAGQE